MSNSVTFKLHSLKVLRSSVYLGSELQTEEVLMLQVI